MTSLNTKGYREQLERLFAAHGVVLAYLFGSQFEQFANHIHEYLRREGCIDEEPNK